MAHVVLQGIGRALQAQGQTPKLGATVLDALRRLPERVLPSFFVRPYIYVEMGGGIYVGHLVASGESAHA